MARRGWVNHTARVTNRRAYLDKCGTTARNTAGKRFLSSMLLVMPPQVGPLGEPSATFAAQMRFLFGFTPRLEDVILSILCNCEGRRRRMRIDGRGARRRPVDKIWILVVDSASS